MKKCLVFLFMLATLWGYSQQTTVVQLKNGGVFLEQESRIILHGENSSGGELYLGPKSKTTLINGLRKGINWMTINKNQMLDFKKEIARFPVMSKSTYIDTYRFENKQYLEAKLLFLGRGDGSSKITLIAREGLINIEVNNEDDAQGLINILQGKSGNSKIDNIFQ